jgi:outer membrane protein assembly factor BamE (lipoprotein component of BamABCDE complex)
MKKILLLSFFLLASCSLREIQQNHGVNNLEIKQSKLILNKTNKNEIIDIIGPPSTKNFFENDVFIYIERKTSGSKITKLGKKKLIKNDVLVLEIDNRGILISKKFYNKNDIKMIDFENQITGVNYSKDSFINKFLNSLRQKIDDPLGKKRGSLKN